MSHRPRILRVRGHQALLNRKHQVVSCIQGRGRQGRVAAAEADLQGANRLAQTLRCLGRVVEAKRFDVVQQDV
jgi:hypothetical protein